MNITIIKDSIITIASCYKGERLIEVLSRNNIYLNAPCGGKGTCKKCKVKVNGEVKLGCTILVEAGMQIEIDPDLNSQIVTSGIIRKAKLNPIGTGYGVAVDIGTTTVAVYLIDLSKGTVMDVASALNLQKAFGDDVISRVSYITETENGLKVCTDKIIKQIEDMISILCVRNGIKMSDISNVILVGNTIMLHIALSLDPSGIAKAPFTPVTTLSTVNKGTALGFSKDFVVTSAPCVSGYVGGDTVSAAIACSLDQGGTSLLVDIGTNGEMVLTHNGKMMCCSTAAGPAFEGAHIHNGIGSVEGAINKVTIDTSVAYTTIGDKEPVGICGSGIVDSVAQLIKCGIVDETGYMNEEHPYLEQYITEDGFMIADNVIITQKDIREVQLAKSAIYAGIETLVMEMGITYSDIETVYLAGGLGSYIDKKSAIEIGLLPFELLDKIKVSGNAAGNGAVSMMTDKDLLQKAIDTAKNMEYIELSTHKGFQDRYVDAMFFPKLNK